MSRKISRPVLILTILAGILIGAPLGLGTFTFYFAEGHSYLSNNPSACINCHIMNDQYRSWSQSSHRAVAVCNDCHTPGNIFQKYAAKASNGFWHSWAFTTGRYKEPIEIKPHNKLLAEKSCLGCHQPFLESSNLLQHRDKTSCIRCHSQVGHSR